MLNMVTGSISHEMMMPLSCIVTLGRGLVSFLKKEEN